MGGLSSRLDGCTVFSKLDLQKGYYQVPVAAAADIHKTAVITSFGLFEFVRMPFGLKNAGITFQRLMDRIFFGLPFCFVYLDDLLVASCDMAEHHPHLRQALQRLQENGLVINLQEVRVWAAVSGVPGPPSLGGRHFAAAGPRGSDQTVSKPHHSPGFASILRPV
jgi:Reverse transcriptase (RNA-dependent DNA polymerase)